VGRDLGTERLYPGAPLLGLTLGLQISRPIIRRLMNIRLMLTLRHKIEVPRLARQKAVQAVVAYPLQFNAV